MPRIVISTQNFMFADMIKRTLEGDDFSVTVVEKPEKLMQEFNRTAANIVLMEVTGYTPWKIEERMKLRNQILAFVMIIGLIPTSSVTVFPHIKKDAALTGGIF